MRTKIAEQFTEFSRKLFASLPWGYRVALLFDKLAIDSQSAFGRFVYSEFIKAGVLGLPDVNGEPALSLRPEGPRIVKKLPPTYGKDFGAKIWRKALALTKSPERAEDALSAIMIKMVHGGIKIREGVPLHQAEDYIGTAIKNEIQDRDRSTNRRREVDTPEDEEGNALDFTDPKSFDHLEDLLSRSNLKQILNEAARVNDRAPSWIESQLDGLSNVEIAEKWGVSPAYVTKWTKSNMAPIQQLLTRFVQEAA